MTLSSQTGPSESNTAVGAMEYCYRGADYTSIRISLVFSKDYAVSGRNNCKARNGLKGIVAENNPNNGLRPRIKIISKQERDCYYIDLYDRSMLNVTIVESLAI